MKHVGGKLRPQFRGCVCCVVSDTYLEFRSNVDSLVAKLPARAADVRQTIPLRYVCRTSAVCGWSVTHVMLTEANSYTSSVSFHFRKRTRPLVDCVVSARSAKPQRSPSATSTLESTIIGACSTTGRAFFSHQPRGAATKMSLCVSKAVRGLMLARTLTLSQFHRTRRLFVARDGDILY